MSEKLLPTTKCPNLGEKVGDGDDSWVQDRCCCNCKYHARDHRHCSTEPERRKKSHECVCGEQKGWVCLAPEFGVVFSGWKEHGLCEMHTHKCVGQSALWVQVPKKIAAKRMKPRKKP